MSDFIRYDNLYYSLTENGKLIHVGLLLKRAYVNYPNNQALVCDDNSIDYKSLYYHANLFAKKLLDLNVTKGDRIAILYENSIDFYIAYFAVWAIGAIVVPLNIFLIEPDIVNIIQHAESKVLIVSDKFLSKFKALNNLNITIIADDVFDSKVNVDIDNIKNAEVDILERDSESVAAILYTSGTTGIPKGVMLTSKNIIINAIQGLSRFESSEKDRVYCPLPLFHSLPQNTCIWSTVIIGATAITASKIERHRVINSLKHKPTIIMAVPAVYGLFCKMRNLNFDSVRFFISGGDILTNKIRKYFELIYRRKLCNGYGLTETAPFIAVDLDDYTQLTNTIGTPLWGVACQIRDSDLNVLDVDHVGVLWVSGENVMKGYYNQESETKKVIKDGWFNTGDLAYINKDGKIVISGREKDLIKYKGIKIYPSEIENLLLTNDKVLQAAVIGKKVVEYDANFIESEEEYPVAFVASHEKDLDKLNKELLGLARNNLAPYKVPRNIIIKRELPVGPTGKVDKKLLRNLLSKIH